VTKAVAVALPSPEKAPGIREGIRERAAWDLAEVTEGWGLIEPKEGAGAVYPYFNTKKLCDAQTTLSSETLKALADNPAAAPEGLELRTSPSGPPNADWRKALMEWGEKVTESGRRGADLAGVSSNITALPPADVSNYLLEQAPLFLKANPDGSFWFFEADRLFPRRVALLRILLALATMPDFLDVYAETQGGMKIETLQEHSLTGGANTIGLVDVLLLAIPPTAMGFTFGWLPHAIVFLFGHPSLLLEPHPPTLASLYVPRLQGSGAGFHWRESEFWEGVGPAEVETLFQWWATRLNVIYSYALDPTNFDDGHGRFDVKKQAAWFLTFERLLADALSVGSSPQSASLARLETGFDLLDKAESLLGYGQDKSGKGSKRLLRRTEMINRLDDIWDTRLPVQLRDRFKSHTRHLYDRLYDNVKANAYDFRVVPDGSGIKVWSEKEEKLIKWSWDQYIPDLVRAVRNSAHGIMETFDKASERNIVVAHSGEMPPELPELAAFLALAIVADAERVCAGTWWD
jgi:hypothetical protein